MAMRVQQTREIEIKLRVTDLANAIRGLKRLGAVVEGRVHEQNTLYDTPDAYFRRTGRLLRVRIEKPAGSRAVKAGKGQAVVTFKAPAPAHPGSQYKEKLETEASIRRPERWDRTLRSLGFRPGFEYEKYRSSFRLSGLHALLDETPVGTFLELEGPPATIDRVARRLRYTPRDYIRGTYWDLYAADCARRGKSPRNMLFRA
jgi:adenylate cyclase class 2